MDKYGTDFLDDVVGRTTRPRFNRWGGEIVIDGNGQVRFHQKDYTHLVIYPLNQEFWLQVLMIKQLYSSLLVQNMQKVRSSGLPVKGKIFTLTSLLPILRMDVMHDGLWKIQGSKRSLRQLFITKVSRQGV
jgi:hypothetical protein